ncbi:hypothetical protein HNY73_017410 [Argiope bruennichi]|uniref:MACPF domain-containing protein n=1 Tax=Argiope bruennichi TaxID=94029 RepID=A0A8T0EAM2_ARGBR|nr:hypothetical protein HNY73_017410 [Argiope bruennichi]
MSSIVFYVIPALLGRAYDLKNDSVGADLFRVEVTQNAKIIEKYMTTSEYKVVSELSEATDFLDVSGKLSLKLKTGNTNLEGAGNYLKETKSFRNKVDLLVKVHYETIIKTLPAEIKPISNWQDSVKDTGMTHYVRSILYGGDLIASVRFTTKKDEDKEVIKATVAGELNSDSGSFGGGLKGGLEKVREKIGDTASMDINYYATVPLGKEIPRTLDGLVQLVQEFPEQTKAVNDGYGVPLSMEVFSLEALDKNIKTYYQTLALQDQMLILDEQLSDIQNSKQRLADWLQTMPPNLPKEQNDMIGEFATKLDSIDRVFSEVIANLNLSAEAEGDQFKPAFAAYMGDREEAIPNMYVKDLSRLKKEVLDGTPSLEGDFGGSHYTHWGSDACPSQTVLVFGGVMSTTDRDSIGSSQYTCMPNDKQYPEGNNNSDDEIGDYPQVQQVAFVSRKKNGEQKRKAIKCSSCRVPGKSTTTMLVAKTECPSGWVKQYQGTLISTDIQQVRGQLVCLDTSKPFEDISEDTESLTVVTEVSPKCGSYPCSGGVSASTALPCVVCSITKKTSSISDFLTIHRSHTKSRYRLIEASSESNDFLNVDGKLALKAKSGWSGNLQGLGKYLKHLINRQKTIELLCTVYHETVAETFPTYTPQKNEWKSKRPEQVGTHYIRSIIYGGQLVISYKMTVKKEEDIEEMKAAVDGALAKEGCLDAHVAGKV